MWDKRANVVSIHDGDTLTMLLDQGFRETQEITVRLFGTFAPELKQVGGPETLAFVQQWVNQYTQPVIAGVRSQWPFVVTTIRTPVSDKEITTLERYVCLVETIDHAHNLNVDVQAFVTKNGYPGGTGAPVVPPVITPPTSAVPAGKTGAGTITSNGPVGFSGSNSH